MSHCNGQEKKTFENGNANVLATNLRAEACLLQAPIINTSWWEILKQTWWTHTRITSDHDTMITMVDNVSILNRPQSVEQPLMYTQH